MSSQEAPLKVDLRPIVLWPFKASAEDGVTKEKESSIQQSGTIREATEAVTEAKTLPIAPVIVPISATGAASKPPNEG